MTAVPVVVASTLTLAVVVLAAAMAPVADAPPVASTPAGSVMPAKAAMTAAAAPPLALAAAGDPGLVVPAADAHALALTDDQHLIADYALRQVMDAYLSDRRNPQRLQQLGEQLRHRLPPAAAAEAIALAARYDGYLAEHAALLIAQNFADQPDLHRLASWQLQRRQLRQRLLGAEVTEQWFGTEDAYLQQALDERRQPVSGPAGAIDRDQQLHAQHMRAVVDAAIGRAPP